MMRVVEFHPDHVKMMKDYGGQDTFISFLSDSDIDEISKSSCGCTIFKGDIVVGCLGGIPINKYRVVTWAILQKTTTTNFVFVHKTALWFMNQVDYKRFEAYVDPEFKPAMRWVKMLGFKMENPFIPYYFPNGAGASYWALMRK